jgi:hypothetical protein
MESPLDNPAVFKCPDDTVATPCRACNETEGLIVCRKTYTNGSIEKLNVSTQYVTSDIYQDYIGGLEPPEKCCLQSIGGNYTYVKKLITDVVNSPIIYPNDGDPEGDCGVGATEPIQSTAEFCGVQVPIKNYDITCSLIEPGETIPYYYSATYTGTWSPAMPSITPEPKIGDSPSEPV